MTRGYDRAGRWDTVTDLAGLTTTFGWDENSNLERVGYPNGTWTERPHDRADRLERITHMREWSRGWTTLLDLGYEHDGSGLVEREGGSAFRYDPLGRLDLVMPAGTMMPTHSYGYDDADNATGLWEGALVQALSNCQRRRGASC